MYTSFICYVCVYYGFVQNCTHMSYCLEVLANVKYIRGFEK